MVTCHIGTGNLAELFIVAGEMAQSVKVLAAHTYTMS